MNKAFKTSLSAIFVPCAEHPNTLIEALRPLGQAFTSSAERAVI